MEINIKLETRSIKAAIRNVKKFQKRFDEKRELFVRKLMEAGMEVARQNVGAGMGDAPTNAEVLIVKCEVGEKSVEGILRITSEPVVSKDGRTFYPHLAWEFGAGIYYNNGNNNPYASELGMGPGTFPNQKHAINPGYWFYTDNNGQTHLSYGTEATMPMYKAYVEMYQRIRPIAKEVFGGK